MSSLKLPADGTCRCGQTKVRISAVPILTMACHCKGCQRMTSSACSLTAMFPAEGFEVLQGEPVLGGLKGEGHIKVYHYHCPNCMTWIFTRLDGMDDFVHIRPSILEETGWFKPYLEICTNEKMAFVDIGAKQTIPGFPEMKDFDEAMKDYKSQARLESL